jgi:6-phosphogluconolactonase
MPSEINVTRASGKDAPREVAPGVLVCADGQALARAAARLFVEAAWQAIAKDKKFCVALSGGKTPAAFFRILATPEYRAQVDWQRVHLFWGDERPVPPENEESNYGMARRELIIRVGIPSGNVHRMHAEDENIGHAAQAYEDTMRRVLPRTDHGFPRFHLIFLGVGPEGHTASIFPGVRGLRDTSRWVSTPMVPKVGTRRMTFTLPVLNAAERVVFLMGGPDKAEILLDVLTVKHDPPLPAQLVTVPDGKRTILCDEDAARMILDEIRKKGELPLLASAPKKK